MRTLQRRGEPAVLPINNRVLRADAGVVQGSYGSSGPKLPGVWLWPHPGVFFHRSLLVTPAVATGVTGRLWGLEESLPNCLE